MRKFVERPVLPVKTTEKLASKSAEILAISDVVTRKKRARQIFEASLTTTWFSPVKNNLKGL